MIPVNLFTEAPAIDWPAKIVYTQKWRLRLRYDVFGNQFNLGCYFKVNLTYADKGCADEKGEEIGPAGLIALTVTLSKHVNTRENVILAHCLQ